MQVWCLRYHNKAGNAAPASENARRSAYLIKNAAAGGVQPLFIILYYLLFIRKGATLMFTLAIVQSALELGFIYALVAMALF